MKSTRTEWSTGIARTKDGRAVSYKMRKSTGLDAFISRLLGPNDNEVNRINKYNALQNASKRRISKKKSTTETRRNSGR